MKRFFFLLIALLFLTGSASALTLELVVLPTVGDFLGIDIVGYVLSATPEDYPLESTLHSQIGEKQVIAVMASCFSRWLYIPENGLDAEAYFGKAVRFKLDDTFFDESISLTDDISSLPDVLRPVSLEVVGSNVYGTLVEIGEDYLLVSPYKDNRYGIEHDETIRLAINEDTLGCKEVDEIIKMAKGRHIVALYAPNVSCEILYDVETLTVLLMWATTG